MLTRKFIGGVLLLFFTLLFTTVTFSNIGGLQLSEKAMASATPMEEAVVIMPTNMQPTSVVQETLVVKENKNFEEKKETMSDDLYWLSKIVYAEARGEDDKGQQLVAEVVMNRVKSEHFPDTVKDVIFQGNGKQFQPVEDGSINQEPDERAIKNAKIVLENGTPLTNDNVLYFHATQLGKTKVGTKWWNGVNTSFVYGGHVFAKQMTED